MSTNRGCSWFIVATCLIICGFIFSPFYRIFPISVATKQYLGYSADSLLNFTELTGKYGYITDEHSVVTEDGYILQLFRMVKGKNCHGKKHETPVILMHGLLQSSDCWIAAGTQAGLAYLISDACYDLWVGNTRGNYYTRRHVTMDPDKDAKFWKFSAHEIGIYDVPATIDYVLEHTGKTKVNYIGFSQGATTFFIMCSERAEYCDKASLLISLAPASRVKDMDSTAFKTLLTTFRQYEEFLSKIGIHEIFSKGAPIQELVALFFHCFDPTGTMGESLKAIFDGAHPGSITSETTFTAYNIMPAGTSVRNMAFFGQSITSGRFQKYDYGKKLNLEAYGSVNPPEYNMSAVTVPVVYMYGSNDGLVGIKDVKWLQKRLPNLVESAVVSDPLWTHFDFNFSQYISALVFSTVNDFLKKFSDI